MRTRPLVAALTAAALAALGGLTLSPAASIAGTSSPAPNPRLVPIPSRAEAPLFSEPVIGRPGQALGPRHFAGDAVVLGFWSSWCTPCRAELRQLERAWRARPPGTAFLGVDVDDSAPPAESELRSAGVSFPTVADAASSAATAYRIAGTPTIVLVDSEGRVATVAIGPTSAATILRLVDQVTGT